MPIALAAANADPPSGRETMRSRSAPSSEHVLASISEPGAGPSYSVCALARALADLGAEVGVSAISGWRGDMPSSSLSSQVAYTSCHWDFAQLPVLSQMCFSAELDRHLRLVAQTKEIVHGHGLWLMPNIYPAWATRSHPARLVVSPRGMLAEAALSFSRAKKRAFWLLFQKAVLSRAACLHATSDAECAEIRAAGLKNPVAIIPNGVDIPVRPGRVTASRTILSLGRVHPKKGLDRLVKAWARLEHDWPEWRLRIVGPPEVGYDLDLARLGQALGVRHMSIEGPAYGADKQTAYADADVFVVPTLNENFGMTVAEALAAGIPVIATKGAPWSGLTDERCGWWVEHGVDSLAGAMRSAMAKPQRELSAMGARGRAWMARDFGWGRIAADMLLVYAWVIAGGDPPPTVRLG